MEGESLSQECLTQIQISFESALDLFSKQAPEEKPFDYKYESRAILEKIINDQLICIEPENELKKKIRIVINYNLALNYLETEENTEADKFLNKTLEILNNVEESKEKFGNILQDIYNNLGYLSINRDENEKGMSLLAKSEELYAEIIKLPSLPKEVTYNSKDLDSKKESQVIFFNFWEPQVSVKKTENLYTLTLFFLAQAHTKMGEKEKAARYCGNTLKRQFETNEYQLKDWCVNCISLAEYYTNNNNFSQSYYLLQAGQNLLSQKEKKFKLKATFSMSFARLFKSFLTFSVSNLNPNEEELKEFQKIINLKELTFDTINWAFIYLDFPRSKEEILKLFRTSNTQYKKSMSFFVLDGYVTEHISMSQEISSMIKDLSSIENDNTAKVSFLEKRLALIDPLRIALNPKAYPVFYEKLIVESAEICNEICELSGVELLKAKKTDKIIEKINGYGMKCVEMYTEIEKILEEQKENRDKNYYQSVVNTKFNIAKVFSRLIGKGKPEKINFLKKSMERYKDIVSYMKNLLKEKGNLDFNFSEQLRICEEMGELLPVKISKINSE